MLTPADLHGLARLAGDGVSGTSRLVEQLHLTILSGAAPVGKAVEGRTRGIPGLVYGSIRGINALVGAGVDALASRVITPTPEGDAWAAREQWLAALNGILGDHLAASGNPLAIPMRFREGGRILTLERDRLEEAFARPSGRLLIAVHGLCMNDLHWGEAGGMPERLGKSLGFSTLHLHYNTGRSIADNGRELADQLEILVEQWPVPVEEIVFLGHSMGGLVARSALAAGAAESQAWVDSVSRMALLGTPHHGAPMERLGHRFETMLGFSPYLAPFMRLGGIRSAGITDLRHGALPAPLADVELFAVAATARTRVGGLLDGAAGDGLVPIDSALGRHNDPERALPIPEDNRLLVPGVGHLGLLKHPAVYRQLRRWLA
ncbi:alpha/beta hydrolase [Wenzhouxiangella sediminis]|uniref:Alpha/beta hydrolase n=1 Tax=Wenzhouxiangella sediminis TaxID=1792836 RepID=A0A3E1K5S6_9GAMM|nr:alpha/beta hydrolase [Wenzhouxiangella sediminis]